MKSSLFSWGIKNQVRQHLQMLRSMIRHGAAVVPAVILVVLFCTTFSKADDLINYNIIGPTTDSFGGSLFDDIANVGGDFVLRTNANGHATLIGFNLDYAGELSIPNTLNRYQVVAIAESAFCLCTGLTSITVPDTITEIGYAAFSDCTGLTGIYFEGNAPSIGSSIFNGCTNATVYYRAGTKGWYATFVDRPTAVWKQ